MNTDIIQGKWREIKGQVCKKWGKITEDDVAKMKGSKEELAGKLQQAYGYEKDKAEKEIDSFVKENRWDD